MKIGNLHIAKGLFRKNGYNAFCKLLNQNGIYHKHEELWKQYQK